MKTFNLLTDKPVIYAANVSEDDLADDGASNEFVGRVRAFAAEEHNEVFVLCAKIEEEISQLDEEEKAMFLEELGIEDVVLGFLEATDPEISTEVLNHLCKKFNINRI